MNDTTLIQIQARLERVERQNRVLIALLCVAIGIVSIGAAKSGGNVISVDEVRTHRISLIDNHGAVVHSWWGSNGAMNE